MYFLSVTVIHIPLVILYNQREQMSFHKAFFPAIDHQLHIINLLTEKEKKHRIYDQDFHLAFEDSSNMMNRKF